MIRIVGWLLGLENVTSIDQIAPSLAAPWAASAPFWVFFGLVALLVAALVFYLKIPAAGLARLPAPSWASAAACCWPCCSSRWPIPCSAISLTNVQQPLLYLVFDGTESMAIQDEYSEPQRRDLATATVCCRPPHADSSRLKPPKASRRRPPTGPPADRVRRKPCCGPAGQQPAAAAEPRRSSIGWKRFCLTATTPASCGSWS